MSYVFTPPPPVSVPVVGRAERFPVRRIYCVGRNYVEHAKEMGFTGREPPFFFLKPADAAGGGARRRDRHHPYPSLTKDLHHEIELVAASAPAARTSRPPTRRSTSSATPWAWT
jgi:fumarylpyruvate hydrolase